MNAGGHDVRVVLVDDQPLLRRSLAMIIDNEAGLTVVGEADNGIDALAVAKTTRPDVILMDVRMPKSTGSRPPGRSVRTRHSR